MRERERERERESVTSFVSCRPTDPVHIMGDDHQENHSKRLLPVH